MAKHLKLGATAAQSLSVLHDLEHALTTVEQLAPDLLANPRQDNPAEQSPSVLHWPPAGASALPQPHGDHITARPVMITAPILIGIPVPMRVTDPGCQPKASFNRREEMP